MEDAKDIGAGCLLVVTWGYDFEAVTPGIVN